VPCRIIVFSGRKGENAPRDNTTNGHFFVFSRDDLSPRHAKERHFSCVAFPPNDDFFVFSHENLCKQRDPHPQIEFDFVEKHIH